MIAGVSAIKECGMRGGAWKGLWGVCDHRQLWEAAMGGDQKGAYMHTWEGESVGVGGVQPRRKRRSRRGSNHSFAFRKAIIPYKYPTFTFFGPGAQEVKVYGAGGDAGDLRLIR